MSNYTETVLNLMCPCLCVLVPLAGLLIVLLLPLIRGLINDHRIDQHHCLNCNYDLRSLEPGTRRCPECGRNLGTPP